VQIGQIFLLGSSESESLRQRQNILDRVF